MLLSSIYLGLLATGSVASARLCILHTHSTLATDISATYAPKSASETSENTSWQIKETTSAIKSLSTVTAGGTFDTSPTTGGTQTATVSTEIASAETSTIYTTADSSIQISASSIIDSAIQISATSGVESETSATESASTTTTIEMDPATTTVARTDTTDATTVPDTSAPLEFPSTTTLITAPTLSTFLLAGSGPSAPVDEYTLRGSESNGLYMRFDDLYNSFTFHIEASTGFLKLGDYFITWDKNTKDLTTSDALRSQGPSLEKVFCQAAYQNQPLSCYLKSDTSMNQFYAVPNGGYVLGFGRSDSPPEDSSAISLVARG